MQTLASELSATDAMAYGKRSRFEEIMRKNGIDPHAGQDRPVFR